MKTPLQVIGDFGAPTDSFAQAVKFFNDNDCLTKEQYETGVTKIIGLDRKVEFPDIEQARIYFLYTVQETVRAFGGQTIPDMAEVWETVQQRAQKFCTTNTWAFAKKDVEPNVDANGNFKPKKGAKKDLALRVYSDNKDKDLTRKQWIELLVKEVGLTPAGASTYYANLKSGRM